ncbi:hypothetical protein AgCh_000342 [Apium graveolens]
MKMTTLGEYWLYNVDNILEFTATMYDILRLFDTDKPALYLVYDMWDDMIEKVNNTIYGEARKAASNEYAQFLGHMDIFGNADSIEDRCTIDSKMWWLVHGVSALNIERIGNKILPIRAQDLVYVHTNLRLLFRKSDLYLNEETSLWNVSGDHFDPLNGVEELEIAILSLDEPEMERKIYQDDDV